MIDGSRDGDTTVTYDKGAWAFWVLHNQMGRQKNLEGNQSFIAHYIEDPDHPVLQDFVAHMRLFAPNPQAFDLLVAQLFFNVVLPEYSVQSPSRTLVDGDSPLYDPRFTVRNTGTGRMPVEIAAERGVRFPRPGTAERELFENSRVVVELGAGEEEEVHIRCGFKPERIMIDPDAKVLQRGRKFAVHQF